MEINDVFKVGCSASYYVINNFNKYSPTVYVNSQHLIILLSLDSWQNLIILLNLICFGVQLLLINSKIVNLF